MSVIIVGLGFIQCGYAAFLRGRYQKKTAKLHQIFAGFIKFLLNLLDFR